MKTHAHSNDFAPNHQNDPRWELVQRIVASPYFAKSERLSSFLLFICRLSLEGRDDEINEQIIGEKVFDRSANYDPSVDGIVRSHALRLRQRLEQFNSQPEQADAHLRLTIPRGAYVPIFTTVPAQELVNALEAVAAHVEPEVEVTSATTSTAPQTTIAVVKSTSLPRVVARRFLFSIITVIVVGSLLWTLATSVYLAGHPDQYQELRTVIVGQHHPLWGRLFKSDQKTLVVIADSSLVILQGLSKNRITLADYVSGEYRRHISNDSKIPPAILEELASRRYTSVVDVENVEHFFRIPGVGTDQIQVEYARDIHPNDLKSGNVVLLGADESTPWVQMYEPKMNFYFDNGEKTNVFSIINRNPQPNEQAAYTLIAGDPEKRAYGVVAFQPALDSTGDALILEGTSVAGTQAASDFVFDDSYLLPFLAKIKRTDGTIPHFEVLLRSKNLSGNASRLEVLAYRIE